MENAVSRYGNWMQTFTGKKFWPLDVRPEDIDIEDIAHALSMTCRYGGHCTRFYSVAEHSVLVSRACRQQDALWGLLHDASEAYISDIIHPIKPYLQNYKEIESKIMAAICQRFDLPIKTPASVKWADEAILADEAAQAMGPPPQEWNLRYAPIGMKIEFFNLAAAKKFFLYRF